MVGREGDVVTRSTADKLDEMPTADQRDLELADELAKTGKGSRDKEAG